MFVCDYCVLFMFIGYLAVDIELLDLCVAHYNDNTVFATLECVCDMAFADLQSLIICCINFSDVHDIYRRCMHVLCVDVCIVL